MNGSPHDELVKLSVCDVFSVKINIFPFGRRDETVFIFQEEPGDDSLRWYIGLYPAGVSLQIDRFLKSSRRGLKGFIDDF